MDRDEANRRGAVQFGFCAYLLGLLHLFFALVSLLGEMTGIKVAVLFIGGAFAALWLPLALALRRGCRWAIFVGLALAVLNLLPFVATLVSIFNEPGGPKEAAIIAGGGAAIVLLAAFVPGLSALSYKPWGLSNNLAGVVAFLFLGALTQIVIIELAVFNRQIVRLDRSDLYAHHIHMIVNCALAAGVAWLLGAFIRGAIGGGLAGGIIGLLMARIVRNAAPSGEGWSEWDIGPWVVIIVGPVIGAVIGAIFTDRLRAFFPQSPAPTEEAAEVDAPVQEKSAGRKAPIIVAGKGWGRVCIGNTQAVIDDFLGEGAKTVQNGDVFVVNYHDQGIRVSFAKTSQKAVSILFCDKDSTFSSFQGRTAKGIDWDASPPDVIDAYGQPREDLSGANKGVRWRRLVFEGIDFRFVEGKLVRISVSGQ